ncbi:MAG: hypothetical protein HY751_00420 [Nitrospinae bacterium]|nr:hypothetical protein [Nitrospinota bacterium]
MKKKMGIPPAHGAALWFNRELEMFLSGERSPNCYETFAPMEARAVVARCGQMGLFPVFSQSHFELWEATLEIMGLERYDGPVSTHNAGLGKSLIGSPPMICAFIPPDCPLPKPSPLPAHGL